MAEKIFTRNFHLEDSHTLARYRETGGYTALPKALRQEPAAITEEIKKANLRGLGGAAFPTGVKWGFIPKASTDPKYLVINADEGEPGTFKDRYLMERDPHALIEGMVISARAFGSHLGFIYIRGEYVKPWRVVDDAVKEAYGAGLLGKNIQGSGFDFDVVIHRGAGAYICGEETGLLSSLEGKKGWPKIKPPFPAVKGAFGHPTIVNNVETIMAVPHIINRGAEWFAGKGTMIGSAGIIVMDETVSIPEALMVVARFYAHESCGQCTPCRESTGWIYKMSRRIVEGKGRKEDLDTILDVAKRGAGTTICAFYDGAVGPYISYIEKYRQEFEDLIMRGAHA
jgi:NADH:ubiquinone oxidoreductase subunit F (NADH-binding)